MEQDIDVQSYKDESDFMQPITEGTGRPAYVQETPIKQTLAQKKQKKLE